MPRGLPDASVGQYHRKTETPPGCASPQGFSPTGCRARASCSLVLSLSFAFCLEETVGLSCAPCYPYLAQRIDQPRASLGLCGAMLRSRPASTLCLVTSFGECMRVIVTVIPAYIWIPK